MTTHINHKNHDTVTILMPSMGAENMPDFNDVATQLEKTGANIVHANLSKRRTIPSLPWDDIDVIDLSNMRGCLTSFDRYLGILEQLHNRIEAQQNKGHTIRIIPEYEAILWIASKTTYLTHLHKHGIPTIPTQALCTLKNPENASIIAQPDNFDAMFEQMQGFMDKSNNNKFVLKPSTSSLGRGLFFLDRNPKKGNYCLSLPQERNAPISTSFKDFEALKHTLIPYFTNTQSPDNHYLFQEYVPNIETSAVFVNGKPHFIERLQGKQSYIAHAYYGGQDNLIENPDPQLVQFAYQVMLALPPHIQNSAFLRIDIMKDLNTNTYILGEIEGAGATRLWLREANRTNDYVALLIETAKRSQQTCLEESLTCLEPPSQQTLEVSS